LALQWPPVPDGKWSDDGFLNGLRDQGDPEADAVVARLIAERVHDVGRLFRLLQANDTPLPPDAPPPLHDFIAATAGLPPGLDQARLERGGAAFLKNALPSVVVLLASSLPRGYGAPCLCEILSISRDLEHHPYQRLMGVVQLLLNVSDAEAFRPQGRAVVTAQKLRLLHAGVRALAGRYRPTYRERFGVPVNHEDMLATIMAFSYLVIVGLRRLELPLTSEEAEDLYYLWRIFAQLMGIHPAGRPHDDSFVPATLDEAEAFYTAYVRRNDTGADKNPYGVVLTTDNVKMMRGMIPAGLRLFGFGFAPRICMTELLTSEELARVGYAPLPGHLLLKALLALALRFGQDAGRDAPIVSSLARHLLQAMVDASRGGQVSFSIPFSRYGLRGPEFE
jgi:hypothetical protein